MATFAVTDTRGLLNALADAAEGDRIGLAPGTYRLDRPLDLERALTIAGAGLGQTCIEGGSAPYLLRYLGRGRLALLGIQFLHTGELPANVVVVEGPCDIRQCRFSGGVGGEAPAVGAGLVLIGDYPAGVFECEAEGNVFGIDTVIDSRALLQGNRCTGNSGAGISWNGAAGVLRRNRCSGNGGIGIEVTSGAPLVEDNEASGNRGAGLLLTGTCSGQVLRNRIEDNGDGGVLYASQSAGTARGNQCERNVDAGIWLQEDSAPRLEANICAYNRGSGIRVIQQAHPVLEMNVASRNEGDGICLRGQGRPSLSGDSCLDNQSAGLRLGGSTQAQVSDGFFSRNAAGGVQVDDEARPDLVNCRCIDNAGDGMTFSDGAAGQVQGGQCHANALVGIVCGGNSHPLLTGVTCQFNAQGGIVVRESSAPRIMECLITENQSFGLGFGGAATGEAEANQCIDNLGPGIRLEGTASPILTGNHCKGNVTHGIEVTGAAQPQLVGNTQHDNIRSDPTSWTLYGSRHGRHMECKQFAALMSPSVTQQAVLVEVERTLRPLGWNAIGHIEPDARIPGGMAVGFALRRPEADLGLEALSFPEGHALALNLTFYDRNGMVMWLHQSAEHQVVHALYALSFAFRQHTGQINPWVATHGDWTNDMFFTDGGGGFYEVKRIRGVP